MQYLATKNTPGTCTLPYHAYTAFPFHPQRRHNRSLKVEMALMFYRLELSPHPSPLSHPFFFFSFHSLMHTVPSLSLTLDPSGGYYHLVPSPHSHIKPEDQSMYTLSLTLSNVKQLPKVTLLHS